MGLKCMIGLKTDEKLLDVAIKKKELEVLEEKKKTCEANRKAKEEAIKRAEEKAKEDERKRVEKEKADEEKRKIEEQKILDKKLIDDHKAWTDKNKVEKEWKASKASYDTATTTYQTCNVVKQNRAA